MTESSQDLFTSQELLPSQSQQFSNDSLDDLPDFSQLNTSQVFPFQSQNIESSNEKSQFVSNNRPNRSKIFNNHYSKVQIISQSFQSSLFQSQIQEELSFLEENSQFIFSQSQEQEAPNQPEQPDTTTSQEVLDQVQLNQEAFTPFQRYQEDLSPVQSHQEVFMPSQGYQRAFNQSQIHQQAFTVPKPYQEVFNQSQPCQEVFDQSQPFQEVFDQSQPCQKVFTPSPSQQKSQITQIEVDEVPIPESISILHKTVRQHHSDWAYLSVLSGQLCGDFFPMNAYKNLKLSLLLSLASINVNSTPVPIVAIGKETSHANLLMTKIGQLADRFLTSLINFEGSTVETCGTIHAGPLLLARGGVIYIGDWSRLPAKTVMKLLREVETGQVMTEKVQQSAPLECAVWTFWSCSAKIKRDATTINQFMK